MQYIVPGKIPNRDGTLTRVGNYISVYQSNQVKNALQVTFDCYSSQSIKLYGKSLLLTNTMNPAMLYCSNPMSAFNFSYDKIVTRVSFQEFEDFRTGYVLTLDFTTSQVLNSSFEWLSCSDSINELYCAVQYKLTATWIRQRLFLMAWCAFPQHKIRLNLNKMLVAKSQIKLHVNDNC
ncbi:Hypothetical_protein [Hexamita inflata]|uniref:Hypothetical_protein n=1 Tax=Hexamita inflata TaxID=28002 RepID=A0AA86NTP8_9EUKA|nr:Hypothetical protein HINF_LOCUS11549 [Hexamita inflata]CAI9924373.1 Hypothetical protein HINF_LOCUS12018 [Hexamita inflata]CAI9925529.1 Hypothetical protein HINF_LOCUS13174 [Hexamita inflata]